MKIFISWSGEKARLVAVALKEFLQDVNLRLVPWFSDTDIAAGQRWALELATQLETTSYGIICATQESIQSPWIIFEAGALSRSVKGSAVCPYLIDLTPDQLTGPLSQFQAAEANAEQTFKMLKSINLVMPRGSLSEDRLKLYFKMSWPSLETKIRLANAEPLPQALREKLLKILPSFYRANEIRFIAQSAGIPVEEVNFNQAAVHIWRETIEVAARDNKIETLMERIEIDHPAIHGLSRDVIQWARFRR